jgi:hypothetical protein
MFIVNRLFRFAKIRSPQRSRDRWGLCSFGSQFALEFVAPLAVTVPPSLAGFAQRTDFDTRATHAGFKVLAARVTIKVRAHGPEVVRHFVGSFPCGHSDTPRYRRKSLITAGVHSGTKGCR